MKRLKAWNLLSSVLILAAFAVSGSQAQLQTSVQIEPGKQGRFASDITDMIELGDWSGPVSQPSSRNTYSIKLTAESGVISVEYPELGCSGVWEIIEDRGTSALFRERIRNGATRRCANNGYVSLATNRDQSLGFDWRYDSKGAVVASAILKLTPTGNRLQGAESGILQTADHTPDLPEKSAAQSTTAFGNQQGTVTTSPLPRFGLVLPRVETAIPNVASTMAQTTAPVQSHPASRAKLLALIDRMEFASITEREVFKQSVDQVLKFYASQELAESIARFGLSGELLEQAAAANIERSLQSAGTDIVAGVALSIVVDAGAKAFADFVFSAPMLRDLPREWRAPLYALTESAAAEGVGLAMSVSEVPTKGPYALIGPALDRIHDAKEIYEATDGVVQAQTQGIYAIALGAEVTAELAAKYPGPRTDDVVAPWRAETFANIPKIVGPDDAVEVRRIVELGLAALSSFHDGKTYESAQLAREINLIGARSDGPLVLSAEGPFDLVMKLWSGGDAPKISASAFLAATSLNSFTSAPAPHGLYDPLKVACDRARAVDRKLPPCPFAEVNTTVGSGTHPTGAGKTLRPILLLDRPRGAKPLGVVRANQFVAVSEATTLTVPCRGNTAAWVDWRKFRPAERDVFRLSYSGEGEYRFLKPDGSISSPSLGEYNQFSMSDHDICTNLYETWYRIRLESGQTGWALVSAGDHRFDEEIGGWDVFTAVYGLSNHDAFDWSSVPDWAKQ